MERRIDHQRRKLVSQMSREELEKELLTDHLTRLGNRRAWDEWCQVARPAFIGLIDVDGLKWVNDNLGHAAGDNLLCAVAQALTAAGIGAFRIGGDEFAVSADSREEAWRALGKAARICHGVPFEADGEDWVGARFTFVVWHSADLGGLDTLMNAMKNLRVELGLRGPRGERQPGLQPLRQRQQRVEVSLWTA